MIMRVDSPVYFANVQWIKSRLDRYLAEARVEPTLNPIKFVILDLAPVPFIDATGADCEERGALCVVSHPTTSQIRTPQACTRSATS